MISTATRALCATLSALGTAGLVTFANPANGLAAPHAGSAPAARIATVAAMPAATPDRG